MEAREELIRELFNWTSKYVNANERLKALLPSPADLSKGEKMQRFIPTEESLAEYSSVADDVKAALTKLQEIREKLSQLR